MAVPGNGGVRRPDTSVITIATPNTISTWILSSDEIFMVEMAGHFQVDDVVVVVERRDRKVRY
jgi:hypothetical protein